MTDIISEVSDTLSALLAERGASDPTFKRMVSVYRDVSELLGCRGEYEQVVAGLLATTAGRPAPYLMAHHQPAHSCGQ